jgi:pimeloyl-ACP methyl ester carboxylesterase
MVRDVTSVLDDLGISKAYFLGYSMGGWTAYNLAVHAPERVTALMVGGEDPFELSFEHMRRILREGMEAWVGVWEAWSGPLPAARRERVLSNDAQALLAAAQDRPDLAQALSEVDTPCLLFVGEKDPGYQRVHECAERLRNAWLVSLPGLNHYEAERRSDLILPQITAFVREAVPA